MLLAKALKPKSAKKTALSRRFFFAWSMPSPAVPLLCVFGCAETALVNQAPAKNTPGLGPSGFDPHAFGRPGLRAPLAKALQAPSCAALRFPVAHGTA